MVAGRKPTNGANHQPHTIKSNSIMMAKEDSVYFDLWREDLGQILRKFQTWRLNTNFYFFKVFILFTYSTIF